MQCTKEMSDQKLNSLITTKTKFLELIDALTNLEIIIEDRNKINYNKILEIRKTEVIMRKI